MDPIFMIELSPIDILTLAALSIYKIQRSQLSHQCQALTCVFAAPASLQEIMFICPLSPEAPGYLTA